MEEHANLRHEVAEFLRAHADLIDSGALHLVEFSITGVQELAADVAVDVLASFRESVRLYAGYLDSDDLPVKPIRTLASVVVRKCAGRGIPLNAVVEAFDSGETYVWDLVTRELLPGGYSARAWINLGKSRDRFWKAVGKSMRASYAGEEKTTAEKQLVEFRALSDLGQTIVSTVDLESVLGQILEVATSLMQVRVAAIMLLDPTGRLLEPVVDMGLSRTWVQREKIPVNKSISGVVIQRNEYVLAREDELAGFEIPRAAGGRKIRSVLSIPITVDREPIGVIELYDTVARTYTDLDITMLLTFGSQAGVAIKNARLFAEEQKRRRQAGIMTEVAQAVSETLDLDELLETIAEKTAHALGVERCSLFFYETDSNSLMFMAGYGRSTLQVWLLNQFHIPISDLGQATARALRTRQPVLVEDAREELSLEARIFRGSGVRSYLQIPLVVKEELIGLMSLELARGEQKFSKDDIALAETLANQAAVAIQNRRLQEKLFEQQLAIRDAESNERLYREREKSEAVLRATPDAVFVVDRDMRIVLTNPAAEFLTGWSLDEAKGRNCHEVLYGVNTPPGQCPRPDCPIKRVLAGERVAYSEEELHTRSGRQIPSGGSFAPIYGPDGKVVNVIAIYRDISEQKELEKYALVQRELDIASGIQASLLPREHLLEGGVSVHARQQQAKIVGGDWYDYWSDGDRVYLVIGDASGTGVGAALFATMAMSALRVEAQEHDDLQEVLDHVNQSLFLTNRTESFVTVFLGILDLPTMTLSYANAGHEDPLCIGAESRVPDPLTSGKRSLLGIFAHADLDVRHYRFNSGERLVLFTDGLIDVQNSRGKLYGLKRLSSFIAVNRQMPAEVFIDSLIENVLAFNNGEIKDDITLVVCDIP